MDERVFAAALASHSLAARIAAGRDARSEVPRSVLSRLTTGGRDPLAILDAQNATRVPELVPLRTERMSASPFAFYRGTAALMAADLARDPNSGIHVASSGDAHVANFGFYASPQRTLLFDLNDFDEAARAPFEWDLKRLVTSVVVSGQGDNRDDRVIHDAVRTAVHAYARSMAASVQTSPLERYYTHFDPRTALASMDGESRRALESAIHDAEKRTGARAARKLTTTAVDGRLQFVELPPTMTRVTEVAYRPIAELLEDYVRSASVDIRMLMAHYELVDVALRVVGVGSVGTRCHLLLFEDGDHNALLLQSKEAGQSVLIEHGGVVQPREILEIIERDGNGARVVTLQRILQATSDPFLGHVRNGPRDFYVRQFRDMTGSVEVGQLDDRPFVQYAAICATTLARAHAQSQAAAVVAGYVGRGHSLAEALIEWGYAYAELSLRDYRQFVGARDGAV